MINDILTKLVPELAKVAGVKGVIDVFSGMGGLPAWRSAFPKDPRAAMLSPAHAPPRRCHASGFALECCHRSYHLVSRRGTPS